MLSKYFRIVFVLFFGFLFSVNAQESIESNNDNISGGFNQSLDDRTIEELMKVITFSQITEQWNGDYNKGDWESVKNSKPPKFVEWSYPAGVTLYAMQRVYEILKDEEIINYVKKYNNIAANQYEYLRWQKYNFGRIYKVEGLRRLWKLNMLDDCGAMGTGIIEYVLRNKSETSKNLNELVNIMGNYVSNLQYRLKDGSFWRPESEYSSTIWIDDIYMGLPFLVKWSEYTKDESHLTDAANQIINYASYLQDDEDGVWFHGYYIEKKERSCCKWGRGNGWVAVGVAEVLSALPESHPKYQQVFEIYKNQIAGLVKYQAEDGLWHQVLNHSELSFGTETSCSAQFIYAISHGINKGWLDKSYAPIVEKAIKGLKQRITENGELLKICKGTAIGKNLEYYNNRPTPFNDYHGHGLVLLALAEAYNLFEK